MKTNNEMNKTLKKKKKKKTLKSLVSYCKFKLQKKKNEEYQVEGLLCLHIGS